jgi:hypothetical protein
MAAMFRQTMHKRPHKQCRISGLGATFYGVFDVNILPFGTPERCTTEPSKRHAEGFDVQPFFTFIRFSNFWFSRAGRL